MIMNSLNVREHEILNLLAVSAEKGHSLRGQREVSLISGFSLGAVNQAAANLQSCGLINADLSLTEDGWKMLQGNCPERAVILAAGYGMRMVPINTEIPKGLIEVHGEILIERLIRHLKEAGVSEIYIVTGFMKEQYEYLIDEFGVKLLVNPLYGEKNNYHSLWTARRYLKNAYVLPCDIWFSENPFRRYETYSWYMLTDADSSGSIMKFTRTFEIKKVNPRQMRGSRMAGVSFLRRAEAEFVRNKLDEMEQNSFFSDAIWEEALPEKGGEALYARVVPDRLVREIDTYEQLRELDDDSESLDTDAIRTICEVFGTSKEEIKDISILKKGMTNRSFLFSYEGKKYIMRIPGAGTDELIDRRQEAEVYRLISGKGICDDNVYCNPETGYKITAYLNNSRVCDPNSAGDVAACMKKLREFHALKLRSDHKFDIFGQIEFFEKLRNGTPSAYRDYARVKRNILLLKKYLEENADAFYLTHIDANPDNFLFSYEKNTDGTISERISLIDWEYAGMQEQIVDLAMFAIYAMYDRVQTDAMIDAYFTEGCPENTRIRIYAYMAVSGLLWSNWCEYKHYLGYEFGEYSLQQYRYAKDYFKIVTEEFGVQL